MINSTREWDWMDNNKLKDNNMFEIIGISNYQGEEVIDTATSRIEAIRLTHEYHFSFGSEWVIKFRKLNKNKKST